MYASQEQAQQALHRSSTPHRQITANTTNGDAPIPSATSHLPPSYGAAGIPPATYNHHNYMGAGYPYPTHPHGYINPHLMGDANLMATYQQNMLHGSQMQQLQDRLMRKQAKALTNFVTSHLGLALKNLTQVSVNDSYAMEQAILLRSKKPRTDTIDAIYKSPSKIAWDHTLALAAITAAFEAEIDRLNNNGTPESLEKASKIKMSLFELLLKLIKDSLRIPADALMATFSSIFQKDSSFLQIESIYKEARKTLIADSNNRIETIHRTVGICWKHVSGAYCNPLDCPYDHRCLICGGNCTTAQCNYNHARWNIVVKQPQNNYKKRNNYSRQRNRNNRSGNRGGNKQYQNQPQYQTNTVAQGGNLTRYNNAPTTNKH